MESRLPKPVSSTNITSYRSKIDAIKSKMDSNTVLDAKNLTTEITNNGITKASDNVAKNSIAKLHEEKAKTNDVLKKKEPDENKEPRVQPKAVAAKPAAAKPSNINFVKPVQKRPAASNTTIASGIESKRANLKTNMKATVRPTRPATSASFLMRNKPNAVASVKVPAATKPAPGGASKPSKWDYKGRLEYMTNELATLKQKHKEVSIQYNDIQEEILSLRKSEDSSKIKAQEMEETAKILSKEVESLKIMIKTVEEDRDKLSRELTVSKQNLDEAMSNLNEYKEECSLKTSLLDEQSNQIKDLTTKVKASGEKINNLETVNNDLLQLVQDLDKERRTLHNTIQEMKGNIRVFCRVRPKLAKEASKNSCLIHFIDECTVEVGKTEVDSGTKTKSRNEFTFDKVFPPNVTQADVFEELSMLVQSALEGYNVCVFAYGQTGSGKTYTMEGFPGTEEEGMIPRTVKHIFQEMKQFELLGWEYKIEASFLEIYNEQIIDLLDSKKKIHEIRMTDTKGNDLYVSNLHIQEITSPEQLHECLLIAQENRAVAATQSNEHSSRSHSVARIRLIGTHTNKQEVSIGNLNLVDLAGSERLKNEEAVRTTETKSINKSLANLGHVILALLQKQDHIPYRNSKLTHLLMHSLGGNSKTLMLLNISPLEDSYNETLNSLRFGCSVNSCKTGTIKKQRTML